MRAGLLDGIDLPLRVRWFITEKNGPTTNSSTSFQNLREKYF
jgi:hypothetical protein